MTMVEPLLSSFNSVKQMKYTKLFPHPVFWTIRDRLLFIVASIASKYANATNGMLRETAKSVDRYADTILQKTNAPDEKKPDA